MALCFSVEGMWLFDGPDDSREAGCDRIALRSAKRLPQMGRMPQIGWNAPQSAHNFLIEPITLRVPPHYRVMVPPAWNFLFL